MEDIRGAHRITTPPLTFHKPIPSAPFNGLFFKKKSSSPDQNQWWIIELKRCLMGPHCCHRKTFRLMVIFFLSLSSIQLFDVVQGKKMNVGCLLFALPVCVSGRPVYLQSRRYYIRLSEQKRVETIYISFFWTVVVYYVILAHLMADTMAPLNVSTRLMNKMHSNRKRYVSNGAFLSPFLRRTPNR